MSQDKPESPNKTTSEKPISLSPLGFMEAVAALLKTKPELKSKAKKPDIKKAGD
jgi:hypothetical protein